MDYKEELHWWLIDDYQGKEVIRFNDRVEFKKSGILHNVSGAAVKFVADIDDLYYIDGIKFTYDEWNFKMRKRKIDKLVERTKESV